MRRFFSPLPPPPLPFSFTLHAAPSLLPLENQKPIFSNQLRIEIPAFFPYHNLCIFLLDFAIYDGSFITSVGATTFSSARLINPRVFPQATTFEEKLRHFFNGSCYIADTLLQRRHLLCFSSQVIGEEGTPRAEKKLMASHGSDSTWGIPLSGGDERGDVVHLKFLRVRDFGVADALHMLLKCLSRGKDFDADKILEEGLGFQELEGVVAYMHGCDRKKSRKIKK